MEITRTFDLLERYRQQFSDKKDALCAKNDGKWIKYSAQDYIRLSHYFAYGLIEKGLKKGDKIITISNSRPEWNFVDMGMAMAGIVHVPVFTSLSTAEYDYIVKHSEAKLVIASDLKLFKTVSPVCDIQNIYTFDEIDGVKNWLQIVESGKMNAQKLESTVEEIKKSIQPDDFATLIYTSGTTGNAKGVMLSHKNMVQNFIAAAGVFNLTPEDKYLSILPLCHVGGRLGNYQTQFSGASIYYAENMGTIAANMQEIKADGFDAVPRILEKIYDVVISKGKKLKGMKKRIFFWAVNLGLRYKEFGGNGWLYEKKLKVADKLIFSKWREALGGKVRLVGCGGASLQPRLERVFWAAGVKILNMYGLTETSPIITINRTDKEGCRLGSVGTVINGVEVKIAEDGEILCKGHNVMLGYYKDPELTQSVFDEEGWFHTGDIGYLADGKFLMVTDRKKEIFKLSNGKFIAPQVIENKLKESLFIEQSMVIGEHEKFAGAIISPNFNYLQEWCRQNNLAFNSNEELIQLPEVVTAISGEINRFNKTFAAPERITRFKLVPDDWSPATGELSPTLKLKRRVLAEKYRHLIEQIYSK